MDGWADCQIDNNVKGKDYTAKLKKFHFPVGIAVNIMKVLKLELRGTVASLTCHSCKRG